MSIFGHDDFFFGADGVRRIVRSVRKSEATPSQQSLRPDERLHAEMPPVLFRNDSLSPSDTAVSYGVMAVTGCTMIGGAPVVTVEKPSTTFRRTYMVNGPEDVSQNAYGYGWPAGYNVTVRYSTPPTTSMEGFGPKPGSWALDKHYPETSVSFGIVDSSTVTGPTMYATFGAIDRLVGRNNGTSIASSASGSISVYIGVAGSESTSPYTVTGFNRTGTAIGSSKFCGVVWMNGNWYASPWECPTT